MSQNSKLNSQEIYMLLLDTASRAVEHSDYRSASRELRKAWVMGWLLRELTREYQTSYDLRRRISQYRDQLGAK